MEVEDYEDVTVFLVSTECSYKNSKKWEETIKERYQKISFITILDFESTDSQDDVGIIDDCKRAAKYSDAIIIDWTSPCISPSVHWSHCIAWSCGNPVGIVVPDDARAYSFLPRFMYHHSDAMHHNDNVVVHKLYKMVAD